MTLNLSLFNHLELFKFNGVLINSRVLITFFDYHALEDHWEFLVDQKDFSYVVKPFAVVTDCGALRVIVAFALSPSVDQPHDSPITDLFLHFCEGCRALEYFICKYVPEALRWHWDIILIWIPCKTFENWFCVGGVTRRNYGHQMLWESLSSNFSIFEVLERV